MNFFEMCQIDTSLFSIDFARQDPDWAMVKDAYDNNLSRNDDDCQIPGDRLWLSSPARCKGRAEQGGHVFRILRSPGIALKEFSNERTVGRRLKKSTLRESSIMIYD